MSNRLNQNKHAKYCEKFISELRNSTPQTFKSIFNLMNKYTRKNIKTQETLSQLSQLIIDKPELINIFNLLVHPDLKIPEKENSKEELNKVFSKIFAALKKDFPDQFNHVVQL